MAGTPGPIRVAQVKVAKCAADGDLTHVKRAGQMADPALLKGREGAVHLCLLYTSDAADE